MKKIIFLCSLFTTISCSSPNQISSVLIYPSSAAENTEGQKQTVEKYDYKAEKKQLTKIGANDTKYNPHKNDANNYKSCYNSYGSYYSRGYGCYGARNNDYYIVVPGRRY